MKIRVRGAAENNLRDIDVDFGEGLTVVTGISGSGKSSLVFDTLHREVERRFVDVFGRPGEGMRLPPVRVRSVTGSGPTVAVGQNLLNRNPSSLVATASGLHPFLRLLYARFGERSCPACGAPLALRSAEEIVQTMVMQTGNGKVRVTVPLVRGARGSHRTLLSILVAQLGARAVVVDGSPLGSRRALPVQSPHDIELVLGSLARGGEPRAARKRARELVDRAMAFGSPGLILGTGASRMTLAYAPLCPGCGRPFHRSEPVHFHIPCVSCRGRGCPQCAESASVRWRDRSLPELLTASVDDFRLMLAESASPPGGGRLLEELHRRAEALRSVGLGYVGLDRPVPTLSRGEAQRLRLAVALTSRLEDMVHILDEPTIGQHPRDVASLVSSFRGLHGPVIFVEHDRTAALMADRAVEIGPEAGSGGGRLLYAGSTSGLLRRVTHTGRAFSAGRSRSARAPIQGPAASRIRVRGAAARNLAGIDVDIPVGRLTVITGVSGSGKSTLVEEVLVPSLRTGAPVDCAGIDAPRLRAVIVDQSPIGRNPRSNPATYTGLSDMLRRLFASATGLSPSHFSFNRAEGACAACGGMGAVEVRMRYLPSTWVRCEECGGRRFRPEILEARVEIAGEALSIADLYERPVADIARVLGASDPRFGPLVRALLDAGLGYLPLGQPSPSLSGGEAQRVKLTKYLGRARLGAELLVLDEPSTGLHPDDIGGLLAVLDRIVRAGATVVVVEHNTDVIRAADWCIDLGPGAGPRGGRVVAQGDLRELLGCRESATGAALRAEARARQVPRSRPRRRPAPSAIRIRGARANNLRGISVQIPKGKLTVVTGVSGSGKSSLVRDVLEAEARRRYLESLSLYERQAAREGPEAEVDAVSGLGPAVAVSSQRWTFGLRADVGWATEISRHLAVLFAFRGVRWCPSCALAMERLEGRGGWRCAACGAMLPALRSEHFSYSSYGAACRRCHGVGSLQVPAPEKLIIRPDRPLCKGAMYSPGFFPQGYLCKPGNGGHDLVQALARQHGFDPSSTPWAEMSEVARQAFLFGDPEPLSVTFRGKSGRVHTRSAPYRGFYGFVGDWDVGGTYSTAAICPECGGARLRPEFAAVRLAGHTIHDLRRMPLERLRGALQGAGGGATTDPAVKASAATMDRRLGFLCQVGLGYLHLGRIASSLSAGEAQRVRLSGMLGSGLTSLTILLDEPSRGLHPREVGALATALEELRSAGNTVIAVEHDLELIRRADRVIDMGPGPGRLGGRVVAQGSPAELARATGPTARWLARAGSRRASGMRPRRSPSGSLTIRGPRENNLDGEDVRIPLGVLAGVCGVSGSGKSTLCIDILARALVPVKITTSVAREPLAPGRHDGIDGAPARTLVLDQLARGVPSPWRFLGLDAAFAAAYAESPAALALGLGAETLRRGCAACHGSGHRDLDMGFLPAVRVSCDACGGTGVPPEARELEVRGHAIPALLRMSLQELDELWKDEPGLHGPLSAACAAGLGYLVPSQPGESLSGGEVQRLRIAGQIARPGGTPALYILDEPTVGQHHEDVVRLAGVLDALVREGHSVLIVEHHPLLLASCDWLLELGPGAGPEGGRVIAQGTPEALAALQTPTAPYLRDALERAWPA